MQNNETNFEEEEENWEQKIINEIKALKKTVDNKVEKSVVDQIARYQEEILSMRNANFQRLDILENRTKDPETICHDCIDNDDMESAFLTILRYIETISNTKAESILVDTKASVQYADSLFNRLNVISRQQITEANTQLKESLESRLNTLVDEFAQFSSAIEKRVRYCESEINKLEDTIDNSTLVTKKPLATYTTPVKRITEKQAPTKHSLYSQIPKLQPMRTLVRKGEANPNFILSTTKD